MSLSKKVNKLLKNIFVQMTSEAFETRIWNKKDNWEANKHGEIPSLVKTAKMKRSIKYTSTKKSVKMKAVGYAKYQNEGTRTIPKRQFIPIVVNLTEEDKDKLNKILINEVQKNLKLK